MKRSEYQVKAIRKEYKSGKLLDVIVPGSKSITNRALLLAALADGTSTLTGTLFSDDSRHFLKGLVDLGFPVEVDEETKVVRVTGYGGRMPLQTGKVYVGSAGTAARFLTAMLACAGGTYELDASEQMRRRPMKPLLDALAGLGVQVTYQGEEGFFPFTLESGGIRGGEISIDIGVSSQFLSALLMAGTMLPEGLRIHLTGQRKSLPYVEMTAKLMERFGVPVYREADGSWLVPGRESVENSIYRAGRYEIEPDVSGACYFYGMAAILGICVRVRGVHEDSLQGDKKFLQVLEQLGCRKEETPEGIQITGPEGGYPGIHINMNDFSDQTMTMAVVAAFAQTPTCIEGVEHIRYQESNRIEAVKNELERLGIHCEEHQDGLEIYPGILRAARIHTYEDHRMAMAFALAGLRVPGVVIENPDCCRKTFENYFDLLDEITE